MRTSRLYVRITVCGCLIYQNDSFCKLCIIKKIRLKVILMVLLNKYRFVLNFQSISTQNWTKYLQIIQFLPIVLCRFVVFTVVALQGSQTKLYCVGKTIRDSRCFEKSVIRQNLSNFMDEASHSCLSFLLKESISTLTETMLFISNYQIF